MPSHDISSLHHTEAVTLTVNGMPDSITSGSAVLLYLQQRGLSEQAVVVEVNGSIIPPERYADHPLNEGDQVEIIHFVGGG